MKNIFPIENNFKKTLIIKFMTEKSYIFICDYGLNRSPTARRLLWRFASQEGTNVHVDHTGIYPEDTREREEKEGARLSTFQHIIAMTPEIKKVLIKRYSLPEDRITTWNIPDKYRIKRKEERYALENLLTPLIINLLN